MPRRAQSRARPRAIPRRGIQSVEIGLRVIKALRSSPGPQALKQLAAGADLPASNCHRYLVSLVRAGYVVQDPLTRLYDLGPQLLKSGLAALARLDPLAAGTDALARLVDATGYTGQLAIWAEGVVIVRWMPGRKAVHTNLSVGSTLPLLSSATGRVFLAFLHERRTERHAESEQPGSRAARQRIAAQVRAAGFAQVVGETIPGLSAACAPLLDSGGEAAATMTLVGLADGIAAPAIDALRRASAEVSHLLGWSGASAAFRA